MIIFCQQASLFFKTKGVNEQYDRLSSAYTYLPITWKAVGAPIILSTANILSRTFCCVFIWISHVRQVVFTLKWVVLPSERSPGFPNKYRKIPALQISQILHRPQYKKTCYTVLQNEFDRVPGPRVTCDPTGHAARGVLSLDVRFGQYRPNYVS